MTTSALNAAQRIEALGLSPVFSDLPASELGVLAEMLETEYLRAGELLCEYGEPSDRVYLVVAGTLSVFVPGQAQPVRTLHRGALLGEYGMFGSLVRTATVKADTDATLLSLDYQRFRAFLLQFPAATLVLLRTAVERLVAAEAKAGGGAPPPAR